VSFFFGELKARIGQEERGTIEGRRKSEGGRTESKNALTKKGRICTRYNISLASFICTSKLMHTRSITLVKHWNHIFECIIFLM
jgi:hypothetical protein